MKKNKLTLNQAAPKKELASPIGKSYIFMCEEHDWHGCEVVVLKDRGDHLMVARCCDVAEGLLAPKESPKRQVTTWSCTKKELW